VIAIAINLRLAKLLGLLRTQRITAKKEIGINAKRKDLYKIFSFLSYVNSDSTTAIIRLKQAIIDVPTNNVNSTLLIFLYISWILFVVIIVPPSSFNYTREDKLNLIFYIRI
jgi:hypothetical protein